MATRKLEVEFLGDTKSLERAFGRAGKAADSSGSKFGALGAVAGKAAKTGLVGLAAGAALAGPKIIDLASDAEETASKFRVVFGKETSSAIKQLDAFSKATGTSSFALRDQAAQFQALIRPMGLSTKNAAGMSVEMTKLATDLASFNNTSVQDAMTALRSGLVGESEPLRRFGVQLSATRVEAFAYANGIAKTGSELTAAQKAQAAYGIILKDTKLAQGDATRTADSFANQFKRLKSQVTDLATELGVLLLPIMTKLVGGITGLIEHFKSGGAETGKFGQIVSGVFETVKGAVGVAVAFLGDQFAKHRDDLKNVGQAVRNIGVAIREVWEHVALPIIQRVLPAIVTIIRGAFNVIGGLVKTLTSLLKGDFRDAWDGVKQIFQGALQVIGGIIRAATAPLREAAQEIGDAIARAFRAAWDKVKEGFRDVKDWMSERFKDIRDAAFKIRDAIVGAFDKIAGSVKKVLDFFDEIVDKIGAVVSAIGKIKLPKIDIPFIGSPGPGEGKVNPTSGTYGMANRVASMFGLHVTSGYRSPEHNRAVGGVPNSLHTHGSPGNPGAIDMVGPVASMYAALEWARGHLRLQEALVHDVGSGLHLHLGFFAKGGFARGWGVVGEEGPELVNFGARGGQVYSNPDSQAMLGGATVNIGTMVVTDPFDARRVGADLAWRLQTS